MLTNEWARSEPREEGKRSVIWMARILKSTLRNEFLFFIQYLCDTTSRCYFWGIWRGWRESGDQPWPGDSWPQRLARRDPSPRGQNSGRKVVLCLHCTGKRMPNRFFPIFFIHLSIYISFYLFIYLSIFISFFLCLISLSPFLSFILTFSHLFFLSCLPAPLLYLCRYVFLSPLLSPYFSLTLSNVFRSRESTWSLRVTVSTFSGWSLGKSYSMASWMNASKS